MVPRAFALDLAALRIAVAAVVLTSPDVRAARLAATWSVDLRAVPWGLGWVAPALPGPEWLPLTATVLLMAATTLLLVGLWTRASATLATLSAVYLLALPQLVGTVRHTHHLVWFLALIACSPCGDAVSLDRHFRARRGEAVADDEATPRYGVPLRLGFVVLGLVYFFPGLWKLVHGGWAWVASDQFIHQMHWKWAQMGRVPALRVDQWPLLCQVGAGLTVAFELGFLPLAVLTRWRIPLVLGCVAFHIAIEQVMLIPFQSLWLCALGLWPWTDVLRRVDGWLGRSRTLAKMLPSPAPTRATAWGGALLVAGIGLAGAREQTAGWPFACYPTFARMVGEAMPLLEVTRRGPEGQRAVVPLRLAGVDGQRHLGLQWQLGLDVVGPRRTRGLTAYLRAGLRPSDRSGVVCVDRTWVSTVPERVGRRMRRDPLECFDGRTLEPLPARP